MSYTIVITENVHTLSVGIAAQPVADTQVKRYEGTVDQIDLPKVISAVMTPPPKKRVRRAKAEKVAT